MGNAPKILGTDSLRQAYPKLNMSIDNSNEAILRSIYAETTSNDAKNKADGATETAELVRKQFDQVTGASTIDPAVEQMKVDNFGTIHASPDARLRSDFNLVNDGLTQTNIDLEGRGINVKALGAKGDGLSDDTPFIQQALNYAKASRGVTVIIPDGSYVVKKCLSVYNNTSVKFGDNAKLIRSHSGAFFCNWEPNSSTYVYHGNISIEGGVLDGNIANFPSGFNAVNIAGGRNFVFRGMEIRDVKGAHAFDLNGCSNVMFDGCRFLGFKLNDDGSGTVSEAIQISNLTPTSFGNTHDFGGVFNAEPTTDVRVINCTFGPSENEGSYPVAVGNHSAVHDTYNRNIRILHNNFFGMTYAAIRGFKFADVFISENLFEGCARCVYMDSVWGGIADGNKNAAGEYTKIPQSGSNITISNNLFKNNTAQCVYITGAVFGRLTALYDNIKVIGNTVDNTNAPMVMNLFHFTWSSNILIENNKAQYGGRIGWFEYCQDFAIGDNNTLTDFMYDGIVITEQDVGFNFPVAGEPGYDSTIDASTVASWYKSKGYTANFRLGSSKIKRVARNGLSIYSCFGFKITNTSMEMIATATDIDRDAIRIDNGSKDGEVIMPTIKRNPSYVSGPGGTNRHAIYVTNTCQNIRVQAGEIDSKGQTINLNGTNVWNGVYYYAPNGTRYKQTISNTGQPVYTAG